MNKKYLSVVLFGALLAASAGTFTSCKDYDDDIKGLQEQIDGNQTSVAALEKQLATLDAAAKAAQTAADAAKTAADAAAAAAAKAQAAGDKAAADAATAKTLAEAAQAAAAQAKVDAIAEATKQVTALKTLMEQSLASKIEQADLDIAIAAVNAQIEGIQQGLGQLISDNTAKIVENANDIKDAKEAIANLIAADEDLKLQIAGLTEYDEILKQLIGKNGLAIEENATNIEDAKAKIEGAQNEINELWKNLNSSNELIAQLFTLISENKTAIDENGNKIIANTGLIEALTARVEDLETTTGGLVTTTADHKKRIEALEKRVGLNEDAIKKLNTGLSATNTSISTLENKINGELTTIKGDIGKIGNQINNIVGMISEINGSLNSLHTLIVCRLTSITIAPDLFVDGIEAVRFTSLQYSPMGEDENASIPATSYKFSTAALATASYHFNPASFNLDNATYGYADRTAEVVSTVTRATGSKLVEIAEVKGEDGKKLPNPSINLEKGTVEFKLLRLNSHTTQPGLDRTNMIALQATLKDANIEGAKDGASDVSSDNAVITSPYVAVYDAILSYEDVRIADKETLTTGADDAHYATTFNACMKEAPRYETPYDKEFNLKELVATCFGNNGHDEFPIADYKLSYRFDVASTAYNIEEGNTETNQQSWVVCNDKKEGTFQADGLNPEAFGRTPILKVELVDEAGNVVRRGFVKIKFTAEKYGDLTVGDKAEELVFKCADTEAEYTITEEYIRENVYRKITDGTNIGMSHETFWNTYDVSTAVASVKKNGKLVTDVDFPKIVAGATNVGTATKKVVWSFKHGQLGAIGAAGSQFVANITVKNKLQSSKYPDAITFEFTVNVKLPKFSLETVKNEQYWQTIDGDMKFFKVNAEVPDTPEDPADGCLIHQELNLAYTTYNLKGFTNNCVTDRYVVTKTYSDGKATSKVLAGVKISGKTISLDKNDATVKSALNSAGGLQASVAHVYTLASGDQITVNEFMINFIRPVSLNMPSGVTLTDAIDGGDVANFQWNGLLMDWRGNAIVSPSVVETEDITGYWKKVCTTEYEWVPEHSYVKTPASLNVTYGKVDFVTASDLTMYSGTAKVNYWKPGTSTDQVIEKSYSVGAMLTQAEAMAMLEVQEREGTPDGYISFGSTYNFTEIPVIKGSHVEYTYVANIDYVPAEIVLVPGEHVAKKHDDTPKPEVDGDSYGQKSGCWEWTKAIFSSSEINLGQYWFYYGEFSDVKLDISRVTTDLKYNGGQLPAKTTLVQVGNTVKYVNVDSPIEYAYKIFIPASVNYGWGTLSSTLTITVNPKK